MVETPSPLATAKRIQIGEMAAAIRDRFGPAASIASGDGGITLVITLTEPAALPTICKFLFWDSGCSFGGMIAEERQGNWRLSYLFLLPGSGWIEVLLEVPTTITTVPSISSEVHAADWHEREAEDLFGLRFEGHPRLGDFILHDQMWPEGVAPYRKLRRDSTEADQDRFQRYPNPDWRPLLVVQDPGAFAMPVGPVYEGGLGQSVHFLLETVGEDVVRAVPRLFYNFRGVEKLAEGEPVSRAMLLAERFAATSSFAHSLAFCLAVETMCGVNIPARAKHFRILLSELERLRHHTGAITAICESTALAVAASQAAMVEERLLRASCQFAGHRYLFGLNTPGGLRRDFSDQACAELLKATDGAVGELRVLENRLYFTSSFLDRLEDAGIVNPEEAHDLNFVGPVGRASGRTGDLRRDCPYGGYEEYQFKVPREREGDGYARLRILFQEAYQSAQVIRQAAKRLEPEQISVPCELPAHGVALGWVEAPIGAALHWLRLDGAGMVERYRIVTASFNNWLGFRVAVENFAFQDFPIILATFGLSATECDR
ncbi:MAG: NADH-quinone oxidoreductase subunit C [Candidatus Acidiferrales bacterium]